MIVVPKIGIPYDVQVQTRNSLDPPELGTWSVSQEETPVESTLPIVDAPAAPSKTGATSSSITISWTAVTGAAKYRVRSKTGSNAWDTVEVAAGTRYTAEMLDASTTYRFEVSAYGDGTTQRADWGAWSTHLDAATNAAPTVSGCTTTLGSISGESSYEGEWTNECVSSDRPATRYARYYTFELATAAELTIELASDEDTYLYLMSGGGTSGTELAKNDDSRDSALGRLNSRITYEAGHGIRPAIHVTYRTPRRSVRSPGPLCEHCPPSLCHISRVRHGMAVAGPGTGRRLPGQTQQPHWNGHPRPGHTHFGRSRQRQHHRLPGAEAETLAQGVSSPPVYGGVNGRPVTGPERTAALRFLIS